MRRLNRVAGHVQQAQRAVSPRPACLPTRRMRRAESAKSQRILFGIEPEPAADRGRGPDTRRGLDAAGMLSAAGIVAAGATALTGVVDWTVSADQDRRVGLFHGLLNTAALGLQGASLGARMTGHRSTARALGAASLTVTGAAAYLGGHLVFTKGVMVNRVAWATGPRRWTRALPEADLPDDSPTAVDVEGRH